MPAAFWPPAQPLKPHREVKLRCGCALKKDSYTSPNRNSLAVFFRLEIHRLSNPWHLVRSLVSKGGFVEKDASLHQIFEWDSRRTPVVLLLTWKVLVWSEAIDS
jgi:hypothetical protein